MAKGSVQAPVSSWHHRLQRGWCGVTVVPGGE